MKATLNLNGKDYEVEISEEMAKDLEQPQKTGYERNESRSTYYCIDYDGQVTSDCDCKADEDNNCYEIANYYSDKTVAENNARADTLMRKLRRFAVEHRKKDINWNDDSQAKYEIYYYHKDQGIKISPYQNCQDFGSIYFDTHEAAKLAIEEFKDELIWYFTEYRDSL